MNLQQFLRQTGVERNLFWGVFFVSNSDAIKAHELLAPLCNSKRIESLILLNDSDYEHWYDAAEKIELEGEIPTCHYCDRLLFSSPQLAEQAKVKICEQMNTTAVVAQDNQLFFACELDTLLMYSAISLGEIVELPGECLYIPGISDEDWCLCEDFCWVPLPFVEAEPDNPQILIRDQDAHRQGIERTVWINAVQEPETIIQNIAWWLSQSPVPDAQEWKTMALSKFPIGYEVFDWEDLVELSYVAQNWKKHGKAFWLYWKTFRYDEKAKPFEEVEFLGQYLLASDFFRQLYKNACSQQNIKEGQEGYQLFYCLIKNRYLILHDAAMNLYIYQR
jgi:hypothetical protein